MSFKINKTYSLISLVLFTIEALIAKFLTTGFIRHTFGDYLVVILLFCFIKSFTKLDAFKVAMGVLSLAFFIEFLQLLNVLKHLGLEHNQTLILILGNTFQISDLIAYTLGVFTVIFFEYKIYKLWMS